VVEPAHYAWSEVKMVTRSSIPTFAQQNHKRNWKRANKIKQESQYQQRNWERAHKYDKHKWNWGI